MSEERTIMACSRCEADLEIIAIPGASLNDAVAVALDRHWSESPSCTFAKSFSASQRKIPGLFNAAEN